MLPSRSPEDHPHATPQTLASGLTLSQMGSSASYAPDLIFSKSTASLSSSAPVAGSAWRPGGPGWAVGPPTSDVHPPPLHPTPPHPSPPTHTRTDTPADDALQPSHVWRPPPTKGGVTRQQDEQDDAHTPHVHRRRVLFAAVAYAQHLGSNVLRAAAHGGQHVVVAEKLQAEGLPVAWAACQGPAGDRPPSTRRRKNEPALHNSIPPRQPPAATPVQHVGSHLQSWVGGRWAQIRGDGCCAHTHGRTHAHTHTLDSPKSAIFTGLSSRSLSMTMFSSFKSRCTMPECRAGREGAGQYGGASGQAVGAMCHAAVYHGSPSPTSGRPTGRGASVLLLLLLLRVM